MTLAAVLRRQRIPRGSSLRIPCRTFASSFHLHRQASELETVLRAQDPHDRIQFFRDVQFPKEADNYKDRMAWLSGGLFSRKIEAEPHLLPFWTVLVHISRTWFVKNVADGGRYARFKQIQWPTAQAFTIAAVPESHWAHGLVLTPDPFDLSVCSDEPWSLDPIVRGDNTHLYPHYDPELAPKFAYGPPKMTRGLLQEIAERQPLSYNVGLEISILEDGMREVHVLGDTSSFFFPHYRLLYRQTNDPDNERYFDTSELQNGGVQRLVRIPGRLGRRSEEDLQKGFCRPTFMQWSAARNEHYAGYCHPSDSADLHELLISAMRNNPIQDQVWEDATILPWSPMDQTTANWLNFETYTPAFLQKKPIADPLFPGIQRKGPTISDHLRRRAASASAASGAGAAAAGATASARVGSRKGPTVTDSREQVETRNRLLRQRLREQVQRQRAWKEHLGVEEGSNWKTPSMPGTQSQAAAAYEEKQYAAGRPQPAIHKILSDPRSYYKRLGMQPEARHLQYFHERAVDAEIKERYRELTLENHPDRAQTPEEEARLHHIMANINVAKDNLETAEKRIDYHNRFSPTKLYR